MEAALRRSGNMRCICGEHIKYLISVVVTDLNFNRSNSPPILAAFERTVGLIVFITTLVIKTPLLPCGHSKLADFQLSATKTPSKR